MRYIAIISILFIAFSCKKTIVPKPITVEPVAGVFDSDFTMLGDDTLFNNHGDRFAAFVKTGKHRLEHLVDTLNLRNANKVSFGGENGDLIVNDIVYTNWNNKETIEKLNYMFNDSAWKINHYYFYNPKHPTQTPLQFQKQIDSVCKKRGGVIYL